MSDRRPLKFVAEIDSNTIIVRNASQSQLTTIAELIDLYDIPEPVNTQAARYTRLFHIKHSRASLVATTIKDAYRDLLSGNDKAFQQKRGEDEKSQRPGGGGSFVRGFGPGGGNQGQGQDQNGAKANFKGKLSMGIDDVTNTILATTEGETLMNIVAEMINELDVAAQQADNVRMLKLNASTNAASVQRILAQVLGQGGATPSEPGEPQPQQPSGRRGPDGDGKPEPPRGEGGPRP